MIQSMGRIILNVRMVFGIIIIIFRVDMGIQYSLRREESKYNNNTT